MDLTLSKALNSPMESHKRTFEEPNVRTGKSLHNIKATAEKVSGKFQSMQKACMKAPCRVGNSQILVMVFIHQLSDI